MSQDKITIKTYKIVEEVTEMTKEEFMDKYETVLDETDLNDVKDKMWKYLVDKEEIVLIEGNYEDLNIDENSFDYNGYITDYIVCKLPQQIDMEEDTKIQVSTKCKKCDVWFSLDSKSDESLCKMCK